MTEHWQSDQAGAEDAHIDTWHAHRQNRIFSGARPSSDVSLTSGRLWLGRRLRPRSVSGLPVDSVVARRGATASSFATAEQAARTGIRVPFADRGVK